MSKLFYRRPQEQRDERGVMLITILVIGMILTFVGLSLADLVIVQYNRTGENVYRANATLVAEAGIEETLSALNTNNNFTGFSNEEQFYDEGDQGRATYTTRITNGPNNQRFIESTGKTYRSTGKLVSTRTVKVSLVGTSTPVPSVIAGAGGLILGGSASINNSDVHVNGFITMNGASAIGSDTHPVNVNVANANCPKTANPGPTYPQVCTTGQPITIPDYGSVKIIGTTCVTHQDPGKSEN